MSGNVNLNDKTINEVNEEGSSITSLFSNYKLIHNELINRNEYEEECAYKQQRVLSSLQDCIIHHNCSNSFVQLLDQEGITLHQLLVYIINTLPLFFRDYPSIHFRIKLNHYEIATPNLQESIFHNSYKIHTNNDYIGKIEAFVQAEKSKPFRDFTKEQKRLLSGIASSLGMIIRNRQESEVLQSERVYSKTIISLSPVIILRLSPNGIIIQMNPAGQDVSGYSANEVMGKRIWEIPFIDLSSDYIKELFNNIVRNELKEIELSFTNRNGDKKIVFWRFIKVNNGNGTLKEIIGFGSDITDKIRTRRILEESEKRFRDISLSIADWIWEVDENWKYTYTSTKASHMLGYSDKDLKEKTPFDLIEEESSERIKKMFTELAKQKKLILDLENWKVTKYGTKRCFSTNGVPIFNEKGRLTGYRGIDKDITEKKKIETRLIESEERYRRIFELSPEAIILLDEDGLILEVNNSIINWFGCERDKIIGSTFSNLPFIPQENKQEFLQNIIQRMKQPFISPFEIKLTGKKGNIIIGRIHCAPMNDNKLPLNYLIMIADITEAYRAQEKILQSLQEKEILLREVHHRVNNNLQIITGLIGMQIESAVDDNTIEILNGFQSRIISIALVHERVCKSKKMENISFEEYTKELLNNLFLSCSNYAYGIDLQTTIKCGDMHIKHVIPCGFIINELVSNALKHAFNQNTGGVIKVNVSGGSGRKICIIVEDNGRGLPDNIEINNSKSLGFKLVNLLARQLNANINIDKNKGTKITVQFETD